MIHCIAIDDEPLALQLVQEYCAKISFLKLEKTFTNTDEAIAYMQSSTVDLLFLDIQMPDITGIQFYKGLSEKPPVIFTTAYKDFAVEGFNVDAVDYLLKPFEYDRFLKACYKAKEYIEFLSSQEVQLNSLFIKVNYEIMKINLKDIDLIEALDDYIKIYIKPNPVLTLMTLKSIQEKLPPRDFVRIHRFSLSRLLKLKNSVSPKYGSPVKKYLLEAATAVCMINYWKFLKQNSHSPILTHSSPINRQEKSTKR